MAIYSSDGKKLINIEYDVTPKVGDIVDELRVLSVNKQTSYEYAVFLLEPNTRVTCYIFDKIYIIGKASGFESLYDAMQAWKNDEI